MSDDRNVIDLLPTTRRGWIALLNRLGVRPSKGRGQNFLLERGIGSRIATVAEIGSEDAVVEVGAGLGILTEELLRRAATVVAIEVDNRLAAHLSETFGHLHAFQMVEGDVLRVDLAALISEDRAYHVVANLPYSIASAVIRHFLEQEHPPVRMTLMVQEEVAERIVAKPPDMSILAVATQFYAFPRVAFPVNPSVFFPPPKVHSCVIVLDTMRAPRLPRSEHVAFFQLVNAGFRQRRKQIANSIASGINKPKAEVSEWLSVSGVDPTRRAETLSVDEWVALTHAAPPGWLT